MEKVMLTNDKVDWLRKILAMAEASEAAARKRLEDEIGPAADDLIIENRINELYAAQARKDKIERLLTAAVPKSEA